MELFDAALGFEPWQTAGGVATCAPFDVSDCDGESLSKRLCERIVGLLSQNRFVVTLGGEHTSVVGAIHAHCSAYSDLTVVQLDAHSDLRDSYLGSPWNHACTMARVLDFHDNLVQVGIRSQAAEERALVLDRLIPVFYAHEIHHMEANGADWVDRVIEATASRVYVTLDCDVLDPSVLPSTGTPEPGGLTWTQIDALMGRFCQAREVVGLDISELAPIPSIHHPQFTIAKLLYRFLGYRFPPS